MIVISGALVLVALVLLVIGVAQQTLPFVYASIGVSLVSLVFLVIGILQRRGETAPAEGSTATAAQPSADAADGVTAVIPSQSSRRVPASDAGDAAADPDTQPVAVSTPEPPVEPATDGEFEIGGTVLVVEGRPRYHVDGCRYLTGKSAEEVDVFDARDEGFTPCGVCKPDATLEAEDAAAQAAEEAADAEVTAEDDADVVQEDVPGVDVAPARRSAAGGTRAVPAPAKAAKTAKAPAKTAAKAPAKAAKAPAKVASKAAAAAAAAPAKSAAARKAPARTAVAPVPATKAPARAAKAPSRAAAAASGGTSTAKRAGSVVVIPDRGKFHAPTCRFVRGVDGTEVMTKTAAGREGYTACGVCKP